MNTLLLTAVAGCRRWMRNVGRPCGAAFLLFAGLSLPMAAGAQGVSSVGEEGRPVASELRRAELRRALVSGPETPSAANDRRRMTSEERDALHRELRSAMRGAYRDMERRPRDGR